MDYQDLGSHYKGCKIFERLQSGIDRLNKNHFRHKCNDRLNIVLYVTINGYCGLNFHPLLSHFLSLAPRSFSVVKLCSRFQPFTAETVTFCIVKHRPNRRFIFQIDHSPFHRHFRAIGWPAGIFSVFPILLLKSLVIF